MTTYLLSDGEKKDIIVNSFWAQSTNAGTITFQTYAEAYCLILLVGGGAGAGIYDAKWYGGWSNWQCAAGGSGAFFSGTVLLKPGVSYKITIGGGGAIASGRGWSGNGGNTVLYGNNQAIVTANGGGGCENAAYLGANYAGQGGTVVINQPSLVGSIYVNRRGNNGGYGTGNKYGPSAFDGNNFGLGAGGNGWADGNDLASANPGKAGFASWSWANKITTYKYKMLKIKQNNIPYVMYTDIKPKESQLNLMRLL